MKIYGRHRCREMMKESICAWTMQNFWPHPIFFYSNQQASSKQAFLDRRTSSKSSRAYCVDTYSWNFLEWFTVSCRYLLSGCTLDSLAWPAIIHGWISETVWLLICIQSYDSTWYCAVKWGIQQLWKLPIIEPTATQDGGMVLWGNILAQWFAW